MCDKGTGPDCNPACRRCEAGLGTLTKEQVATDTPLGQTPRVVALSVSVAPKAAVSAASPGVPMAIAD